MSSVANKNSLPTGNSILSILLFILLGAYLATPFISGLWQALTGSFGYLPIIKGLDSFSLEPWRYWLVHASNLKVFGLSAVICLASTFLTLLLSFTFLALFHHKFGRSRLLYGMIFVFLSIPHLALALGLINGYSESGIISRAFSSIMGTSQPSFGIVESYPLLAMIICFVLKEVPFVLYVSLAELEHLPLPEIIKVGRSLGYSTYRSYQKMILPQVYSVIRLPIIIVMSYSLSSVEVPLAFGDLKSRTAAVAILEMFYHPRALSDYLLGFSGSILLIIVFLGCLLVWLLLEKIILKLLPYWISLGGRSAPVYQGLLKHQFWAYLGLGWLLPFLMLGIWSFSYSWRFPDLWPTKLTLLNYTHALADLWPTILFTATLAATSSLVGLVIALVLAELELSAKMKFGKVSDYLALVPLILPQISFLFGFQLLLEKIGLAGHWTALVWSHSLFCFSYAFFILKKRQQKFDPRLMYVGYSLGLSKIRVWWKIKFPQILPAVKSALGMGFSVSVALYLPTIFASGGRHLTLMSESMALLNSFTPRISATYAAFLTILPFIFFFVVRYQPAKQN